MMKKLSRCALRPAQPLTPLSVSRRVHGYGRAPYGVRVRCCAIRDSRSRVGPRAGPSRRSALATPLGVSARARTPHTEYTPINTTHVAAANRAGRVCIVLTLLPTHAADWSPPCRRCQRLAATMKRRSTASMFDLTSTGVPGTLRSSVERWLRQRRAVATMSTPRLLPSSPPGSSRRELWSSGAARSMTPRAPSGVPPSMASFSPHHPQPCTAQRGWLKNACAWRQSTHEEHRFTDVVRYKRTCGAASIDNHAR